MILVKYFGISHRQKHLPNNQSHNLMGSNLKDTENIQIQPD